MTYQVTENDVQTFVQWASAHQIKKEDADTTGDTHHNAQAVYDYMHRWGVPWTRDNLDKALVQLRPHVKFYESSAQAARPV